MVAAEVEAEGFDDEVVVFTLREARDGDATDDAVFDDVEGKAAAVGSVISFGEAVLLGQSKFVLFEIKAEVVGTLVETGDHVGFSLDPSGVIGGGAGEGSIEEGLVGLVGFAEAADVDDDGLFAAEG